MTDKRAAELIWDVRTRALDNAPDEDTELDFHGAALELGCSDAQAEDLDCELTIGIMRARGAI